MPKPKPLIQVVICRCGCGEKVYQTKSKTQQFKDKTHYGKYNRGRKMKPRKIKPKLKKKNIKPCQGAYCRGIGKKIPKDIDFCDACSAKIRNENNDC